MPPKNIERFNRIAVTIFTRLYEEFPNPLEIEPKSFGYLAYPKEQDSKEMWDRMDMAANTMSWLEEEGFISVKSKPLIGKYTGVRLTQKGLTVMGMPVSLEKDAGTVADTMKEVLSESAKSTASQAMTSLLGSAAMYAMGAARAYLSS